MEQTETDLISVVTVVYNGEHNVEQTIVSILQQDWRNIQLIVIDGGSTDSTMDILERYRNKVDILISEPDKGIYDAMNKAIPYCKGKWVNFMNVGDTFYSPKTLKDVFYDKEYTGVSVIYGDHIAAYGSLKVSKYPRPLAELWKGMTIQHQSTFVRTEILQNRLFDTRYKYAADYDLMYECYKNEYSILYIPEFISIVSANGFSESNSEGTYRDYRDVALKFEHNSLPLRAFYGFTLFKRRMIATIKKLFPQLDRARISAMASK